MLDFFLVHVSGADRSEIAAPFQRPDGERYEDMSPSQASADSEKPGLGLRMGRIRPDSDLTDKQLLDLGEGNAMSLTLALISFVPIKT